MLRIFLLFDRQFGYCETRHSMYLFFRICSVFPFNILVFGSQFAKKKTSRICPPITAALVQLGILCPEASILSHR